MYAGIGGGALVLLVLIIVAANMGSGDPEPEVETQAPVAAVPAGPHRWQKLLAEPIPNDPSQVGSADVGRLKRLGQDLAAEASALQGSQRNQCLQRVVEICRLIEKSPAVSDGVKQGIMQMKYMAKKNQTL